MPRATGRPGAPASAKKTTPSARTAAPAKRATGAQAGAKKAGSQVTPAKAAKKTAPAKAKTPPKAAKTTTAAAERDGARPATGRKAALDKFLLGQRETLIEERATYLRQAESLRAEADLLAAEREPGDVQFDEESGEGDTLAVERERDLALSAQAHVLIDEIDAALIRIESGTYGTCVQCGQAIPKERLRALPYASLCVRCKSGGLGRR